MMTYVTFVIVGSQSNIGNIDRKNKIIIIFIQRRNLKN